MDSNNQANNAEVERCKSIMSKKEILPMFSIKNIIVSSTYTMIPWFIILVIAGMLVII